MEILNPLSTAQSPHIFSTLSRKHSIKIHTNKRPFIHKSPWNPPLRSFTVAAHFGRRRESHLRKKLIEQQVRQNPTIIHNPHTQNSTPKIHDTINNNPPSNSAQQSVPNPDNNRDDASASNTYNLNHKVEDVKHLLAKEMEIGKNGLQDTIGSITLNPAKLSRVGISVFCGFFLFVAFNSFFRKQRVADDKEEYSRLEKEMLRRKIKARMAREKPSIKGSSMVEVIQDSKEPEPEPEPAMMMFKQKPELDKEELINALDGAKIQEIRAMARHAREIESNKKDNEQGGTESNPASFDVLLPQRGDLSNGQSIQETVESSSDASNINQPVAESKESVDKPLEKKSVRRIITSVKEAREYLHKKEEKQEPEINNLHSDDDFDDDEQDDDVLSKRTPSSNQPWSVGGDREVLVNNSNSKDERVKGSSDGEAERANHEKWMEDNFHEFQPLVEKIRGGFRNNYMVAREKVKEDTNLVLELEQHDENGSELEWMKDEKLREIVFQVRENELMGRDPFYLMDTNDKALFFKGLEKKVDEENKKLAHLHEYLHSNIENLDYGADGISLYDSPEKIIPRWKGPPPASTLSVDDYLDQRKALFAETLGNLDIDSSQKSNGKQTKNIKTVIEGSDGSVKAGKKSGKEFWQHTKKWSRGFIDSYNAESDPETKAAMKDIGKDLDRWITEKEIQDAADIMDKVPDKGKKLIAEKMNKLRREMELFGPQAVVSKYSEYGDEEEIDYYWWLDLPFLLCIEMYIDGEGEGDGDGEERIGFYSLEMATDLELDPTPHHIIAFEDAGDCKNFCYVIQTHMEMLGNGNAFVVPQLPKDTYQEARANGFNVTVIRKGELKLDVDQTLEEVEEKIVEIGSKMYHDQIMKSHNVNVDSLMNGVFGLKKKTTNSNSNRRRRRRLKRPTK